MTEFVQNATVALADWIQRNAAPAVGLVFALGFAWAQFGAIVSAISETRGELRELRREFLSFRLSDSTVTRQDHVAAFARQRDIDLRQDAALAALRDRFLSSSPIVDRP